MHETVPVHFSFSSKDSQHFLGVKRFFKDLFITTYSLFCFSRNVLDITVN